MVTFLSKLFRAYLFEWRRERAIRKADRLAETERRCYLVLVERGKPVVVSMQGIKRMIKRHRFVKGFTAEKARQMAIHMSYPNNSKSNVSDRG